MCFRLSLSALYPEPDGGAGRFFAPVNEYEPDDNQPRRNLPCERPSGAIFDEIDDVGREMAVAPGASGVGTDSY
jgi:hypothetical protein